MSGSNNFFQSIERLNQQIDWLNQVLKGGVEDSVNIDGLIKPSIAKDVNDQFAAIAAMVAGRLAYPTRAMMDADTSQPDNTLAEVWNDDDDVNNRLYVWFSGSWHISKYDSFTMLDREISSTNSQVASLANDVDSLFIGNETHISDDENLELIELGALGEKTNIIYAITDMLGKMAMGVGDNGTTYAHHLRALLGVSLNENTLIEKGFEDYHLALADENDHVAFGVKDDGQLLTSTLKCIGLAELGSNIQLEHGEFNYDFAIADRHGCVGFGFINGLLASSESSTVAPSNVEDLTNKQNSLRVKDWHTHGAQRNVFDYNHLVVYGQSLSTGHEGWPVLSRESLYGNLMLGDAVRPQSGAANSFIPVGENKLKPLVANVNQGNTILTPEQEAALPSGDGSLGETQSQGWANFAKKLHNDHFALLNDMNRRFVSTNNGVSGRSIEALSKGANPELYLRYTQAIDLIKGIAEAEKKTYGVTGIFWAQGEYNYIGHEGSEPTKDGYKAKLLQLRNDMVSDAKARTGQIDEPAFFTYQTGASYTSDKYELGVGMAQWEFAKENRNCFMVGPVYPYPDKGGHLTANGYRWHGNMLAKVYHRVVTLGQDWKPLQPIKIIKEDERSVLVHFHVPEPPLVFDAPYVMASPAFYKDKGFSLKDGNGEPLSIADVSIVGDTLIRIKTSSEIPDDATLWYAAKSVHNGNGNVRDSDNTVAHDCYLYDSSSGQYPEHNIPELVDKPYPLHNWLVAFCLPVGWNEKEK